MLYAFVGKSDSISLSPNLSLLHSLSLSLFLILLCPLSYVFSFSPCPPFTTASRLYSLSLFLSLCHTATHLPPTRLGALMLPLYLHQKLLLDENNNNNNKGDSQCGIATSTFLVENSQIIRWEKQFPGLESSSIWIFISWKGSLKFFWSDRVSSEKSE